MALGSPPVNDPRSFDLRAFQGSVAAIRERLKQLDIAVTTLVTQVNAPQTGNSLLALQIQVTQLTAQVAMLQSQIGTSQELSFIASSTLTAGQPVIPTGTSTCGPVDTQDPASISAVIGLAKTSVAAGATVSVQTQGNFSVSGAVFTPGEPVYADVGGTMSQYPGYADVAIPIGMATASTTMWVKPGWAALRVMGFNPGYEDFLPATVGLIRDVLELVTTVFSQPDGIVVKVGNSLVTRALIAGSGSGLFIDNPDGVAGDPRFDQG